MIRETCLLAMKHPAWRETAKMLSGSTKKQISLNLFQIDDKTKEGDTILILGKVLSKGELTKKIRISALGISAEAREKLKKTKTEFVNVIDEIKKNPKFEGVKLLK